MSQSDDQVAATLPASVHPALAAALARQGYARLTPVQEAMLDPAHAESDLLVSAQTGSGKTVAFGIAMASTLLADEERFGAPERPLALVIAPTRELAMQVRHELDWLYDVAGIRTATAVGGLDIRRERRALETGAHLVVGTPGRLRDHIDKGVIDLTAVRAVVLDEADEMLDLGFREDLEFILAAAPATRRTLMFSATVPHSIAELAKTYQRQAVRVSAGQPREQHADIEYRMMVVRRDEREAAIINALLDSDSAGALVFCHTREAVRHLFARLSNRGFAAVALSGEMAQGERSSALQAMRDGRARVCVATDVAARGIDLPGLDLVIHADVPSNPETLLHRSGRTGRAGRKGVCVLVVPENRRGAAARVLSLARLTATTCAAPDLAAIEARYRRQILDVALAAAAPDEGEQELVAQLLETAGAERLAAAFLRAQLAARPMPEDISPVPLDAAAGRMPRRDRRAGQEADAPRGAERGEGVWFTLSLGRDQRADPKWLLPMICKAGGVGKRDVGAIRIGDTETLFEIAAHKAEAYAAHLASAGRIEKGVTIALAGTRSGMGPGMEDGTRAEPPGAARFRGKPPKKAKRDAGRANSAPWRPEGKRKRPGPGPRS